jgi:hypothetical protein
VLRRILLVCGVLSSLLYVGTDVLAAIRHAGYHSFTSLTISELMARGAPTKPLVDPLFMIYDVLVIAFGVGLWMSGRGNRPLRLAAGFLIAYAVAGLPGPWFFPMNLRGTADVGGDVPHIVLTGAIVLLIVGAVASGAFALGRRFRLYSFATILTMVVFGALTSVAARAMASGQPTPWIGILERIDIGAFLAWAAVLALAAIRSPERPRRGGPSLA